MLCSFLESPTFDPLALAQSKRGFLLASRPRRRHAFSEMLNDIFDIHGFQNLIKNNSELNLEHKNPRAFLGNSSFVLAAFFISVFSPISLFSFLFSFLLACSLACWSVRTQRSGARPVRGRGCAAGAARRPLRMQFPFFLLWPDTTRELFCKIARGIMLSVVGFFVFY